MAPGSFECLRKTRGSAHVKQQEEEIKSCSRSSCALSLALELFHSLESVVLCVCESEETSISQQTTLENLWRAKKQRLSQGGAMDSSSRPLA